MVVFDQAANFGSREHYFHFLLGYLLPGLHAAGIHQHRAGARPALRFMNCGPIMNGRIHDACTALGIDYRIEADSQAAGDSLARGDWLIAPRWDAWLCRGIPTTIRPRRLLRDRYQQLTGTSSASAMRQFRRFMLDAATKPRSQRTGSTRAERSPHGRGEWLLLKRSSEPSFYQRGGGAEVPHYGTGRRSIANLETLADQLQAAGLPIRIYEPGSDTLIDQINTFHNCAGVIAIRGAELANQIWMRPGSHTLMLATPLKVENYAAWNLAHSLRIRFQQLQVDSNTPHVDPQRVLELLPLRRRVRRTPFLPPGRCRRRG